jgi:CRISPR-associated exonuclease Cas4
MEQTPELLPLSALNQYSYCPRRCFLIHGEGEFQDNVHTVLGSQEHERVDRVEGEWKEGSRVEYALPVWSDALGLSGRCDAVEFRADGSIYPVEHKHGKRKPWLNDDLQLAAQALCLEEMLDKPVTSGAIFHQQSRRRREVTIDEALKETARATVERIRALLAQGVCPPPLEGAQARRCVECSLRTICQPELIGADRQLARLAEALFEPDEEPGWQNKG